ncbi:MAG TPA: hypothetical protein VGE14_14920 [Marmoricola sp.]
MSRDARGSSPDDDVRFTPTSGTAIGWIGLAVALGAAAWAVVDEPSVGAARWALALVILALVIWCFMLRPRIVVGTRQVELRNAFSSWHVPLASVRKVVVRAFTRLHTEDGRYDGVAVGRPIRSMRRGRTSSPPTVGLPGVGAVTLPEGPDATNVDPKGHLDADMVADFVTERILERADRARTAAEGEPQRARRSWAVPELALLALLAVALAVTLLA